ncbi:MAG: FtsQ-type POTRA domain-containing protein [Tissierellales bacterium]
MSKIDRKIRKKKKRLIFLIILLLSATFFILYTKTSFFHISSIEIIGNEKITDEKLILASGIIIDENIFKINLKMVEENVLLHPYIKSVKIKRRLPNKMLINVDERKEVVIINDFGTYMYLDEEGIILNILSEIKDEHIIEIYGLDIQNPRIGDKLSTKDESIQNKIFDFINSSKDLGLINSFERVILDEEKSISIFLHDEGEVAFGTLDDIKYKLNFLISILEELEEKNQGYRKIHLDKGSNAIIIKDND